MFIRMNQLFRVILNSMLSILVIYTISLHHLCRIRSRSRLKHQARAVRPMESPTASSRARRFWCSRTSKSPSHQHLLPQVCMAAAKMLISVTPSSSLENGRDFAVSWPMCAVLEPYIAFMSTNS